MLEIQIFEAELRFMELVWKYGPVKSTELVGLALERMGWKKSTTYTVIRRLAQRGVLKNEDAVVTALVGRGEVLQSESEELIDTRYGGSLKLFLASFLSKEPLTEQEARELKDLIDRSVRKEGPYAGGSSGI